MALTVSAVAVLALIVVLLLRTGSLRFGPALAVFLLGFFTAGTGADGPIRSLCAAIANAIPHLTS
ncbi:hypothetical protein [Streptomyces roseifaciens]|uniref:hypothetical protein n=1 Tax=Streptomyces roseifaciens TaxID=1488406 RepID=UPI0007180E6A|nr:hypothetical protein [Streptomyces roseifaciens]